MVYGETSKSTIILQTYKGNSDEELLSAVIKLWDVVEEYKMLLLDKDDPAKAPPRRQKNTTGMVGMVYPPIPEGGGHATDTRKKQEHIKSIRMAVF